MQTTEKENECRFGGNCSKQQRETKMKKTNMINRSAEIFIAEGER